MSNQAGDQIKTNSAEAGTAENTQTTETETAVSLDAQLAQANAKAAEYLDGWQRARADFANYRKRADKERDEIYATAALDTLMKILPVVDDFDLAMSHLPPGSQDDAVAKSVQMIHRKMATLLENAGMKAISPEGEQFNPAFHEAVGQDTGTDKPAGTVTTVLRKGYQYGDKVLRPALVKVAG